MARRTCLKTFHGRSRLAGCLTSLAVLASWGPPPSAAAQPHSGSDLGVVHFPVSCRTAVQKDFERGVALLHHMTYPQARQTFEQVAAADSSCALAQWGIAMTLFQPLWPTRPDSAALHRGSAAARRAVSLASTERERGFAEAAAAFFDPPAGVDYWERIRRWERRMAVLHEALPGDDEVTAFYVLSHLAVAPADTNASANAARASELLLQLYAHNPDHPGAMHYLVHANDAAGRERQSLEITNKYETAAPNNPHALHMPTHIYTRLGDWDAVIRGNRQAAAAALAHPAGDRGQYVWDEFPHAVEYLVYAYLQTGADDSSAAQIARLHGTANLEPTFKTAFHLASTAARHALERGAWREAATLPPRQPASLDWDRFAWPEAVVWFARGLGAVHTGAAGDAREATARLETLERSASDAGEVLFARNIRVLGLGVRAWTASMAGDTTGSEALMREAAELEMSTPKPPVTPAPTIPAFELLGDLLMRYDRPEEALAAYRRSLDAYPRRLNGVLGAARAAKSAGDRDAARRYYSQLLELATAGGRQAELAEAREFVAAGR